MAKSNFNFIGKRKIWYGISIILVLASIVSFCVQGMNLGIDFSGGNLFQLKFTKEVNVEQLREIVSKHVDATPSIQHSENNEYIVRTHDMSEEESAKMIEEIKTAFGDTQVLRNERVGPVMGKELVANAQWALVLALILMLIYITIRFKFNFALAAIVPLIHDVIITVGMFSILQVEIDGTFIAAILTILGYSINGTIVIFDRIRENTGIATKVEFKTVVNNSINQTLGRSINTVVAVLILIVSLFVFGGETTKPFALAMMIGFTAGAYSSVFIAGSILTDLTTLFNKKADQDGGKSSKEKKQIKTV